VSFVFSRLRASSTLKLPLDDIEHLRTDLSTPLDPVDLDGRHAPSRRRGANLEDHELPAATFLAAKRLIHPG